MELNGDYIERVYAGVLGKIIGVYLGRPFEGWTYQQLTERFGEVSYYVHEELGKPLVVTDDDISGTFTFIRALADNGFDPAITPAQIGWAWRNYIIENRTILWWGGLGVSTEHTAFLRLKNGIEAPVSGSIATNGQVVAEQIGSQIFIDGWGLVCPGDPAQAADLARRAASVSHDGEAIYGAQVIAAMEAAAFAEPDINKLLATALEYIPGDCVIRRLIDDLREWRTASPDWRQARARVEEKYGYECYGGGCHMVPNHAVIILALLYGDDDFQKTMMIANTAGWDTDCNSGNVGCLMGIKQGLAAFEGSPKGRGPDWRGPVADRIYLPTADGGRCLTDAVRETYALVNSARGLRGLEPLAPKDGARFHFSLPGAVHGFRAEGGTLSNTGHRLVIQASATCRVVTPTFVPSDAMLLENYAVVASPTLYPGQRVRACVGAAPGNVGIMEVALCGSVYDAADALVDLQGAPSHLAPGGEQVLEWTMPSTGGQPIAEIGLDVSGAPGAVTLDWLTWDGTPDVTLGRPPEGGTMWRRAWVNAADTWRHTEDALWPYWLVQNEGRGMLLQGEAEWRDYTVTTTLQAHLASSVGLLANARGLFRYVALTIGRDGIARLVEQHDGACTVMAEAAVAWELDRTYALSVTSRADGTLRATVDGVELTAAVDSARARGSAGLWIEEGSCQFGAVTVVPA